MYLLYITQAYSNLKFLIHSLPLVMMESYGITTALKFQWFDFPQLWGLFPCFSRVNTHPPQKKKRRRLNFPRLGILCSRFSTRSVTDLTVWLPELPHLTLNMRNWCFPRRNRTFCGWESQVPYYLIYKLHEFYPKFFNFKVVSSRLGLEVGSEDIQKNGRLAWGPVVGCV